MLICKGCKRGFDPRHFNSRYCSLACKKIGRAIVLKRYKKSASGIISMRKWRKSKARVNVEKKYRSKPEVRKIIYLVKAKYDKTFKGRINKKNHDHRRRLDIKQGKVTPEWLAILEKHESQCVNCGTRENITMDHIRPLAAGGKHEASNVQPMCQRCNSSKGARWVA